MNFFVVKLRLKICVGALDIVYQQLVTLIIFYFAQLLDEGKLQKADNLFEDFESPENAHKM